MVVAAPKCRLCQHAHWSNEPHNFDKAPKQGRISTFRSSRLSNALEEEPKPGTQLVLFDRARIALELARSVDEVKRVRDQAEAIRLYFRQARQSLEMQNNAAEIKLRAERRMGEMIPGQIESQAVTLSEIGISRNQSSRWQAEASVPEEDFERFVAETKAKGGEITSAGLQRLARVEVSSGSDDGHDGGASSSLSSDPPDAPVSVEARADGVVVEADGVGSYRSQPRQPRAEPLLACPECAYTGPRNTFKVLT